MSETLYRGRFLALCQVDGWEYCQRANAHGVVAVVAVADGCLLLARQHRPAVGGPVIELPAGLVGDDPGCENEALIAAAHRELEEETGYRAGSMRHLGRGPSSAGLSSEIVDFYLAVDPERVSAGGGTDSEDIHIHAIAIDEVGDWLAARAEEGWLIDYKVYAGLWWLSRLD